MEKIIRNINDYYINMIEIMESLRSEKDYPNGLNCYKRGNKKVFETYRSEEEIKYLEQFFNIKNLNKIENNLSDKDDEGNDYYEISLPDYACPICDHKIERNDNTPVTVGGWYGDWHFEWGKLRE